MKRILLILTALAALTFSPGCSVSRNRPIDNNRPADSNQPDERAQNLERIMVDAHVIEGHDIVNPGVRLFLEKVDYSDDPGYTRSEVSDPAYASGTDRPLPVRLTWKGGRATSVQISTNRIFKNPKQVAADVESPVEIYNLVPGTRYYYRVLDGRRILKEAIALPVGPLRMISTYEGDQRPRRAVYNMRDLGGWKAGDGRQHIAYGRLYRGSNIDNLNADPYAKDLFLKELGISVDFDLRGYKGDEHDPQVEGLLYYQLPLRKNFEGGTGQTERLYKKAIRQIVGWLDEGRTVYFHCAAGADRTGTLAFLIEALLGVSESDLSKDFEITTFDGRDKRWRIPRESDPTHTIGLLIPYLRSGRFGDPSVLSINELVYNWATSETQDDLQTEYVSPLTPDEIARLRTLLLVNDL